MPSHHTTLATSRSTRARELHHTHTPPCHDRRAPHPPSPQSGHGFSPWPRSHRRRRSHPRAPPAAAAQPAHRRHGILTATSPHSPTLTTMADTSRRGPAPPRIGRRGARPPSWMFHAAISSTTSPRRGGDAAHSPGQGGRRGRDFPRPTGASISPEGEDGLLAWPRLPRLRSLAPSGRSTRRDVSNYRFTAPRDGRHLPRLVTFRAVRVPRSRRTAAFRARARDHATGVHRPRWARVPEKKTAALSPDLGLKLSTREDQWRR